MRLFSSVLIFLLSTAVFSQATLDSFPVMEEDTSFVVTEGLGIDSSSVDFQKEFINIRGKIYPVIIKDGDTIVLGTIDEVSLTSPRSFANDEDRRKYRKYKYYAAKVYPYAAQAIEIFRKMEYATANMKRRKRKKYIKNLSKELTEKFEKPLMGLSKTQGKILVKMIEKELDTPMYTLIKNLQGRFKAFYWNQSSKLYGYRLKTGYIDGDNPILDAVLQDLDISYDIEEDYDLNN